MLPQWWVEAKMWWECLGGKDWICLESSVWTTPRRCLKMESINSGEVVVVRREKKEFCSKIMGEKCNSNSMIRRSNNENQKDLKIIRIFVERS